jgi:hypothetical protein
MWQRIWGLSKMLPGKQIIVQQVFEGLSSISIVASIISTNGM